MPGFKGHMAGSLITAAGGLTVCYATGWFAPSWEVGAGLAGACILGGLFPDIDTDSKGKPLYYWILAIAYAYLLITSKFKQAAFLGIFALLPGMAHHRGWTHTVLAAAIVPLPILVLPYILLDTTWKPYLPFYLAAVAGYVAHLLLDREFKLVA